MMEPLQVVVKKWRILSFLAFAVFQQVTGLANAGEPHYRLWTQQAKATIPASALPSEKPASDKNYYVNSCDSTTSGNLQFKIVAAQNLCSVRYRVFSLRPNGETGFHHTQRAINEIGHVARPVAFVARRFDPRRPSVSRIVVVGSDLQIQKSIVQPIMVLMVWLQPFRASGHKPVQPYRLAFALSLDSSFDIVSPLGPGFLSAPCPRMLNHLLQSVRIDERAKSMDLGFGALRSTRPRRPELNCKMVAAIMPLVPHLNQYAARQVLCNGLKSTGRYGAGELPASFTRPVEFLKVSRFAPVLHSGTAARLRFADQALTTNPLLTMPVGFPDSFTALDFRSPFLGGIPCGRTFVSQQHEPRNTFTALTVRANPITTLGPNEWNRLLCNF